MSNSNEFIAKEVSKIMEQPEYQAPQNLAMASAWILGNLKAFNLKVLDTKKMSSLADYYVIGSASNITQAQAMADTVVSQLKRFGAKSRSTEGAKGADWILIDLGEIIVHIFLDSARPVYDLENLWAQATNIEIPQDYYFSSEDEEATTPTKSSDTDEYF